MPGRDALARARHRHGRRRPRAPGRVAEVRRARPAAHRPRRPQRRRHVSKGRIFPKFRADLLECAVVVKLMREGRIEPTVVPRNALDVLAQQIVAIAASARGRDAVARRRPARARHAHALLRRAAARAARERPRHARRPLPVAGVRRAAPAHRLGPRRRARSARARARASSRSPTPARSPTAACSPSCCPTAAASASSTRRWSTRRGPARRSCSARRRGGSRRSAATASSSRPRPASRAPCRSGRATASGGPRSSGEAIGAFSRWAVDQTAEMLERDYDLDALAAPQPPRLPARAAGRRRASCPSDRTIVVERFRDEIGDWRLCVLTPLRRARPRRLGAGAERAHPRRARPGVRRDLVRRRDHRPPPRRRRAARAPTSCCSSPTRSRTASSPSSAPARCSARASARTPGRALLIPRAYPGKRTPLWQQRLKSQTLLEVAKRYADFPIILETYRECLRDVLDLPGLTELLTRAAPPRAVARRGRDADRVAVRLLAAVRLRRDLHVRGRHAQRRAARGGAVARPRPAARAARPGGAARADRPRRARPGRGRPPAPLRAHARGDPRRARRRAAPRRRPDRRRGAPTASLAGVRRRPRCWPSSTRERRAVRLRVGGEERWIAADDAGLYRDALGAVPPGGLPEAFLADVDRPARAARRALRAHPRAVHDRRAARPLRRRPDERAGGARARRRRSSAASCAPAGREREWCDPEVLRRLRRASLAVLRKEIEAADQRALAAFLPCWQGVDRHPAAGRRHRPPARGARPAAGPRAARRRRGSATCCRAACGAYSPTWLDQLCASRRGRLGRRRARSGATPAASRCTSARTPRRSAPPAVHARRAARRARARRCSASAWRSRRASSPTSWPSCRSRPRRSRRRCGTSSGPGEVTNDAFAPLRAPRLTLARAQRSTLERRGARPARRFGSRRGTGAQRAGPGPLVADLDDLPRRAASPASGAARPPSCCSSATASSPASRCWPRACRAASRALYDALGDLETLGVCRRGYFVEGLGGAQFALPGAVERLRAQRDRRRGAAARARRHRPGAALRRRAAVAQARRRGKRPARVGRPAPTSCWPAPSPSLYVERGGQGPAGPRRPRRPAARARRWRRSPPSSPGAAAASSRSSASTASPSSAPPGSRCSSRSASAPARASSRSAPSATAGARTRRRPAGRRGAARSAPGRGGPRGRPGWAGRRSRGATGAARRRC